MAGTQGLAFLSPPYSVLPEFSYSFEACTYIILDYGHVNFNDEAIFNVAFPQKRLLLGSDIVQLFSTN